MNSLTTLFFPGTTVNRLSLFPVFLLFQNIHVLSPLEDYPAGDSKEFPDTFIKSGFCQVHTPCPLGPDKNRFLRLLADIRSGRDDYAAQLSSLTLAAMTGRGKAQGEESERSIIRSLSGIQDTPVETSQQEKMEKLWQARLVLAIGDLLDQEEEEITLKMAALEYEEKGLFKELQGDDEGEDEENPFAELTRMESTKRGNSTANVQKRFKAWKTLYLAGEVPKCQTFLAGFKEIGDGLLEAFKERTGRAALPVAKLQLPVFVGWNSAEGKEAVLQFTAKNTTFLTSLQEELNAMFKGEMLAGQQVEPAALKASITEDWEELLAADFPADRFGRMVVSFYFLSELSCATLVGGNFPCTSSGNKGLLAIIG